MSFYLVGFQLELQSEIIGAEWSTVNSLTSEPSQRGEGAITSCKLLLIFTLLTHVWDSQIIFNHGCTDNESYITDNQAKKEYD